jgi:lipid-A-disaccharide synthase
MPMQPHFPRLPNIIAGEYLVPELIQDDANPDNIAQQAIAILQSDTTALIQAFLMIALEVPDIIQSI